ncbi:hypothetical protein PEPNEM18_00265 [Aedoeadaptatus nemausensis]|uniref:Uncharacterized protein n=1 Tax=Aedoeadaptatus nemausensis TaxID=2582829 RepID=A0A6V6XZ46_9FIRM|nr:hypothetical protein [Peptoniphilus nemausensis]CAC9924517.1 hypothetical protein PEPNEM18_00265 [Peptoniphilus nemausensis]
MKFKKILKILAFTKAFKALNHKPVRKASGGIFKKYILWKILRRR